MILTDFNIDVPLVFFRIIMILVFLYYFITTILFQKTENQYESDTESSIDDEVGDNDGDNNGDNDGDNDEKASEYSETPEGQLVTKHLNVIYQIENTSFITTEYSLTFNYKCKNKDILLESCFCKKCGNYICFKTDFISKKVLCSHYKLFDCIHPVIENISGHIHIEDEEKVISTVYSLIDDPEKTEFYKSKLMEMVYDEREINTMN